MPGKTLFDIEEAVQRGTIIQMLVSDAAQRAIWPAVKKNLKPGDALYFSHGFSIVYSKQTGVIPPKNVDVIMVAPKGSGTSVRRNFLSGAGINSSFAVEQDATGQRPGALPGRRHRHRLRLPVPDHLPARGVQRPDRRARRAHGRAGRHHGGAVRRAPRQHGHTPSEAFNETVEELTQSLIRLVDENGMDWMYSNCSATAQRGALDWKPRFKKAVLPVFKELYQRVKTGKECARVLSACGKPELPEAAAEGTEPRSATPRCGRPARPCARCVPRKRPGPSAKAPREWPVAAPTESGDLSSLSKAAFGLPFLLASLRRQGRTPKTGWLAKVQPAFCR